MTTEVGIQSERNQLEAQQEGNKKLIALRDAVVNLQKNRDFRKLILEQFLVEDCARYAQLSADPGLGINERADALAMAQAAGHLKRFLGVTKRMGDTADSENHSIQEELDDLEVKNA